MQLEIEAARRARRRVEQVRRKLLAPSPHTFTACEDPLSEAIACMEQLQHRLPGLSAHPRSDVAELRQELRLLQNELLAAGALLGAAGVFYEGLGRLMAADSEPGISYGCGVRTDREATSRSLNIHG